MGGEVDARSASDAALPAIAPIGGGTSVAVGTSKPRLLQILRPGLITGASDDDPSGIGTYSQAGAQLGFGITWTMLFTYPLMAAIQEISARVGRVTGRGLARLKELSAKSDALKRLGAVVDFELFRGALDRAVPRLDRLKRCYGASGEGMAPSSLQTTDGVPHATGR